MPGDLAADPLLDQRDDGVHGAVAGLGEQRHPQHQGDGAAPPATPESRREATTKPTARPPSRAASHRRRLRTTSESSPPAGRDTRFMTANVEAAAPATVVDRPHVFSKNSGRNDTAASSEPKVHM